MEGQLMMSKKERERLVVMGRIKRGEINIREGSEILSVSYRQGKRIYGRYGREGDKGLIHGSRGRRSNRAIDEKIRQRILERYKGRYSGFGPIPPCGTAEKLEEIEKIDHETLSRLRGMVNERRAVAEETGS